MRVDGVLPDLAFGLFKQRPRKPRGESLTLGISFRLGQYDEQEEQVLRALRAVIDQITPENIRKIVLVSQVSWDVPTMRRIADWLRAEFDLPSEFVIGFESVAICEAAYDACDLVLSNRLHSLLIAASRGCAVLACVHPTHNAKISGLFQTSGWQDNILPIDGFDAGQLRQRLASALSNQIDGVSIADELHDAFGKLAHPITS